MFPNNVHVYSAHELHQHRPSQIFRQGVHRQPQNRSVAIVDPSANRQTCYSSEACALLLQDAF